MSEKIYAVIGLGQFGMTVAKTLEEANCEVLAVDINEEKVQEVADKVTYAVRADVREPGALESLGIGNVDVAIIAVSQNMEASIMATIQAKDLKVPLVIAKASGNLHGRILSKTGADQVIYPEQSMGVRVANNLLTTGFVDVFELSSEFSMAEFVIPDSWVGRTLRDLNVRKKYHINVIGLKIGEDVDVDINPEDPLPAEGTVIAVGRNSDLNSQPIFGK